MCSILGIITLHDGRDSYRDRALELSRRIRHRGPDWSGIYDDDRAVLVHERLAIVGVESGAQPLVSQDGTVVLAANAEIYNHRELQDQLEPPYAFTTGSDCEVILPLYQQTGAAFVGRLNGIFAFVLWDRERKTFLAARDPLGVIPLYYGFDEHGQLYFASEMKGLHDVCTWFDDFPPGHYMDSASLEPKPYFQPGWRDYAATRGVAADRQQLRDALGAAVERQLMTDVPYGVLLSGGLDSSVVTALAKRHKQMRIETGGQTEAWWPQLHSFAIGLEGSPDLAAARTAAEAIGTIHHEFHFTTQEGIDALSDVIHHIETFDVTTIRASTPMYLLARRIRSMGIKMVLSGEGSDEIFGGYLYFHKAPDAEAFHEETVRKLDMLYKFDCLRANKSMAAWGVEARVPFLDLEFLDVAMSFDAEHKMAGPGRIEKQILRECFEDLLPSEILWRQKEQFSDGVGYSWIDGLKDHAERVVSDVSLAHATKRFPVHPPRSKEAYLYRSIFERHFPQPSAVNCVPAGDSIACSTPAALAWDPSFADNADPSGRAVKGVHNDELS
ncbi:MAG: asparagine synthase B [Acidobacteriota bacterium]